MPDAELTSVLNAIRKDPITESLEIEPGELDLATFAVSLWGVTRMESNGLVLVDSIKQVAKRLDQSDQDTLSEEDLKWFQALTERLSGFGSGDDLFRSYFRGVVREKSVAKTYRRVTEAGLSRSDILKMMFSLGTHLAIEADRYAEASRFMRDVNRMIHSILENEDDSLGEAVRYAGLFIGEKR